MIKIKNDTKVLREKEENEKIFHKQKAKNEKNFSERLKDSLEDIYDFW